jgi:hypothetical protein
MRIVAELINAERDVEKLGDGAVADLFHRAAEWICNLRAQIDDMELNGHERAPMTAEQQREAIRTWLKARPDPKPLPAHTPEQKAAVQEFVEDRYGPKAQPMQTVSGFDPHQMEEKCRLITQQLLALYVDVQQLQGSTATDAREMTKSIEDAVCLLPVYCGGTRVPSLIKPGEIQQTEPPAAPAEPKPDNSEEACHQREGGGPHVFTDNGDCIYCGFHSSCGSGRG